MQWPRPPGTTPTYRALSRKSASRNTTPPEGSLLGRNAIAPPSNPWSPPPATLPILASPGVGDRCERAGPGDRRTLARRPTCGAHPISPPSSLWCAHAADGGEANRRHSCGIPNIENPTPPIVRRPRWTPANVKLLLPPRQSRGASLVGLDAGGAEGTSDRESNQSLGPLCPFRATKGRNTVQSHANWAV